VKVAPAREGKVDIAAALGLQAGAENDLAARPSHHDGADDHEHNDFESFVVAVPELSELDALLTRLKPVVEAHDILRVKGFLAVADKPMRLALQGVGPRFRQQFDRPWTADEARAGHLVVIGRAGLDRTAIQAGILG
jgi:cobalamin biosynthesis protein CobW